MKFFKNKEQGSVVMELTKGNEGGKLTYDELIAGDSDAAVEKHVPVVKHEGDKLIVEIGSVEHPMIAEHYIIWAAVETDKGGLWKDMKPEEAPRAEFVLQPGETAKIVYIYCNLHGLWKTEL